MNTDTLRMAWRLVYVSVVLFGGAYLYARVYAFEGTLLLAPGHAERTAVATAKEAGLAARFQVAVPAELLSADNPKLYARGLEDSEVYISAHLPFSVKLDTVDVLEKRPPKQVLALRQGREVVTVPAEKGAKLSTPKGEIILSEIRPWLGLLRTPNGSPMAALSLRKGNEPWTRGVFLAVDQWRKVEPDTGLIFRWFATENEAKKRMPDQLGKYFGARWGALDGREVNWFSALTPGTGATLSDDTEVTLLEVERDPAKPPAILVSLKPKNGPEEPKWFKADDSSGRIRLELPGRFARHVLINAWRDGAAQIGVYKDGARTSQTTLEAGGALDSKDGPGFALRLDDVLKSGSPSSAAKDQNVFEAVIATPEGELALREGQMHALADGGQLRFRLAPQPPRAKYTLTLSARDETPQSATLMLGDQVRRGDWILTYDRETVDPGAIAALKVRRSFYSPGRIFGVLLVFAGCYGFVLFRLFLRRGFSEDSTLLTSEESLAPPPATTDDSDNAVN